MSLNHRSTRAEVMEQSLPERWFAICQPIDRWQLDRASALDLTKNERFFRVTGEGGRYKFEPNINNHGKFYRF